MDSALRSGLSRQVERLLASQHQQWAIACYFHQFSMRRTAQSFYDYAADDAASIRTLVEHLGRKRLQPEIGPIASPQSTFEGGDAAMRLAMDVEMEGGAALGVLLGRARAVSDLSVEQLIQGLHETHVMRLVSLRALSRIIRRNADNPDGVEESLFRRARLGA